MTVASAMQGSNKGGSGEDRRFYGVVTGIVTAINDPEDEGRVKVKFPWLADNDESNWARLSHFMAGKDRGSWFIPQIGDEVLVAFEHGDIRNPYILGTLYNGVDKPPAEKKFTQDNNLRMIKSRSGHIIKLDDTNGSEEIVIVSSKGKSQVTIKSTGDIEIKGENIKINAVKDMKLEAQNIQIKASMKLDCEGGTGFGLKTNAQGEVNASGMLTLKGATVNIN